MVALGIECGSGALWKHVMAHPGNLITIWRSPPGQRVPVPRRQEIKQLERQQRRCDCRSQAHGPQPQSSTSASTSAGSNRRACLPGGDKVDTDVPDQTRTVAGSTWQMEENVGDVWGEKE